MSHSLFAFNLPATWRASVTSIWRSSVVATVSHITASSHVSPISTVSHRWRTTTHHWASSHSTHWLQIHNWSCCDFISIDLSSIHVLHCVFCIIWIQIFNVAKASTVLRVESFSWIIHSSDFTVNTENLENMLFGDIAC